MSKGNKNEEILQAVLSGDNLPCTSMLSQDPKTALTLSALTLIEVTEVISEVRDVRLLVKRRPTSDRVLLSWK